MTTLCCTRALLDRIEGVSDSHEPQFVDRPATLFGDWLAHMVLIERRKCVIFVNEHTLLSFVVAGVTRENLQQLPALFLEGLRRMLRKEGVDQEMIDAVVDALGEVTIGTRQKYDWQLLDCMNDLVLQYRSLASQVGGLDGDGIDHAIGLANGTPRQVNGAKNAFKAWRRLMKRLPHAARAETQRQVIAQLRRELGQQKEKVIALYYISVIPEIFNDLSELIAACNDNGLECTMPMGDVPSPPDLQVHVRLRTILTRLGIPMPGRN